MSEIEPDIGSPISYNPDSFDDLETIAEIHPLARMIVGYIILYTIYFMYLILYPTWLTFIDQLESTISLIWINGPIANGSISFYSLLTLSVSGAFMILFIGIVIFWLVLPAVRKSQENTSTLFAISGAFLVLFAVSFIAYIFTLANSTALNQTLAFLPSWTSDHPEYTVMSNFITLVPIGAVFITFIYVVQHRSNSRE